MSYQSNLTGDEVVRRLNLVLSLEQDLSNLNTTAFELVDIGFLNKDNNPFYAIQADVYNRCLEVWNNNKIPILKATLNNDTVTFVSAMIYDGTRFCGFFHKGNNSLTHYTCNVLDSGGDIYVCTEQPKLISGENIKTINGESILGEGDIAISGGIAKETDPIFSASPAATITDEKIADWDGKQDVISDLSAIREDAALGATALQKEALDDYYTKDEISSIISEKDITWNDVI